MESNFLMTNISTTKTFHKNSMTVFQFPGLTELQMLNNNFMSLQNSVILAKCMRAR